MNTTNLVRQSVAVALVTMLAGCASWNEMSHQSKATTEGATGGAIVGAAVGGPVGAAVGAGVGGVVAHNNSEKVPTFTLPEGNASTTASSTSRSDTYAAPSRSASPNAMPSSSATQRNDNLSNRNAATGTANNTNAVVNDNNIAQGASTMQSQDRDTVREAQRALNDRGFSAGAADGIMGPHTEQALRDFQQAQGLGVTGSLDEPTLSALGVSG